MMTTTDDVNFDEIGDDLLAFQEDEMVQQALHRGVDLKRYGRDLERELKMIEMESVTQYVEKGQQVLDLHKHMQECDSVLARMQEMLLGFQADLGGISEEIKHLQDESLSMSIRLRNRRAAEEKLHRFLDNSGITAGMTENILSADVNESFLDAVVSLSNKLKYLQQTTPPKDGSSIDVAPVDTFVGRSLLPDLEKLKIRAVAKARDYFIGQFNALRKPKTNVQVLQQSALVKYAQLFQFVQREACPVADDLRMVYIESMGKTLLNLFKSYSSQLLKLDLIIMSKSDLIAVEDAALKSMFIQKSAHSKKSDTFALGDRDKILEHIESEPILLHVAMAESQRYPFEVIFRSVIKHLSDAATNEFLFIIDFFKSSPRETFNKIFGRTLSLILEFLENYLLNFHDAIGLLLVIKVAHMQRLVMQRRRVPVLDSFFDRISMLLWPRFKFVFDQNLKSLKAANPRKLGVVDMTPHYVARRYAELVSSIFFLQTGSGSDSMGIGGGGEGMVLHDVQQMRVEMVSLLEKLSALLPTDKERRVFFINNFDQILSVFQERRVVSEEVQKFEDLLMHQRELFAEEEIKSSFPRLVSFVVQTEQAMAEFSVAAGSHSYNSHSHSSTSTSSSAGTGGGGAASSHAISLSLDEAIVEALVREFAFNWRAGIQQINDDVLAHFANFRNGMEILKQVLTQLLLYYTRFQDIIKKSWSRSPAFCRDIISTATILMEIKRYSRTF